MPWPGGVVDGGPGAARRYGCRWWTCRVRARTRPTRPNSRPRRLRRRLARARRLSAAVRPRRPSPYVEGAARDQGFVGACPSCGGSQLHYAEGCMKCVSCGYSDCG